jgi:hypothetical protein
MRTSSAGWYRSNGLVHYIPYANFNKIVGKWFRRCDIPAFKQGRDANLCEAKERPEPCSVSCQIQLTVTLLFVLNYCIVEAITAILGYGSGRSSVPTLGLKILKI